ncbi:hypothetical protein AGDE_12703 [Angomonas deanei]|nr:hypothetical protein AGDE_12703 [Angomonas deanei]|eukprot:EPY23977.1 hypothetical protein AGDE_12703 [Angomonas deanei]
MSLKTGGYNGYCFGRKCVMMPFLVLLGLVVSSLCSSLYAALRYRAFCNRVLAERRKLRHEEADEDSVRENNEEELVDQVAELQTKMA